jgi:hypothetical protein
MRFFLSFPNIRTKLKQLTFTHKAILFTFIFTVFSNFYHGSFNAVKPISSDVVSYYSYLPALIIQNDLRFAFFNNNGFPYGERNQYWPQVTEDNKLVIKTTCGLSFFYLPGFFIGHIMAHILEYPLNGFSRPYQLGIHFNLIIYFLLSLILIKKIFSRYFNDVTVAILLMIVCLGTNFFSYNIRETGMAHNYLFFLVLVFVYQTLKWYEKVTFKNSFLIGFTLGIIILIRPTNGIVGLFFLLINVVSIKAFTGRITFLLSNFKFLLLMVMACLLAISPQLLYWKYVTDHWVYYSYGNERFFWHNPNIVATLFGFRKGLFLYTPLLIFALPGFLTLYFKHKALVAPIVIIFLLQIYIVSSWWCWWFGGSFGARAFIEYYPLLLFPLGALIERILSLKPGVKLVMGSLALFLIILNIVQTKQYLKNYIHYDSMTRDSYSLIFLNLNPSKETNEKYYQLLKTPDYNAAKAGNELHKPFN